MPTGQPRIETVEQTGSTNADLLSRLQAGEGIPDGFWLHATVQIGGRGRMGRIWESPRGNLYCSTVVNLRAGDPAAHTLSLVAGLACYDCLKRSLLPQTPILLKWPNDALIRGAKIAGILLERTGDSVVVGIGVNVCHAPDVSDRETTSILHENGKHGGSDDLVLSILAESFAQRLADWRDAPLCDTLDHWMNAAHPIGTPLRIGCDDEVQSGSFAGLSGEGALLLRLASGAVRPIHAGDVSLMTER